MLRTIDLRGRDVSAEELVSLVPRAAHDVKSAMDVVEPIIADVRLRGLEAVRDASMRFDNIVPDQVRVPHTALTAALEGLDSEIREALEESIRRVRSFHEATVPPDVCVDIAPGAQVQYRWVPVRRVGLYVPGGLAVYPSSVVMNVVAAQAAGVSCIAVVSPPRVEAGGLPDETIMATCALLGVDEVYAVGGAQAIAMLTFGVVYENGTACVPVDVITGPGNRFVAAAKRAVQGIVGIDAEAGPTEVAVIADKSADSLLVAADLVSQAEHDPLAGAVLITDSESFAHAVISDVEVAATHTRHSARVREALEGKQSGVVIVDDMNACIEVADAYAPEHLEVITENATDVAMRIRNAGAIFVGPTSPVSLGDYIAGSNHVLPTGGTARFTSGLGTTAFLKAMPIVNYSPAALDAVADHIVTLAEAENLPAHGEAIRARGGSERPA